MEKGTRRARTGKNNMRSGVREQQKQATETFVLTQEHIDFFRSAPVVWDPSESGAPIIDPETLYRAKIVGAHTALAVILKFGEIEAGHYVIPNVVKSIYQQSSIRADVEGNTLEIPQTEPIEFDLTPEHIKLLHTANAEAMVYFGACGLNASRPYGRMTFFEIDMARALGVPVYRDENGSPCFSEEELARFARLHREMLVALPVFLRHARIEPGVFQRKPSLYATWERA